MFSSHQSASLVHLQMQRAIVEERLVVILYNRVIRSFNVMAPERQKMRGLYEEKFSKPLESKMRQIFSESNHSCRP